MSDGTPEGTSLVADLAPGRLRFDPVDLTPFAGRLFFAPGATDQTGVWVSDGNAEGTFRLSFPCPGSCNTPGRIFGATAQRLLFQAGSCQPPFQGNLWTYDTAGQLSMLPLCYGYDTVAFRGNEAFLGLGQLWRVDLTTGATVQLTSWPASQFGPTSLKASGNLLFFSRNDAATGTELWVSDGTAAGTVLVKALSLGFPHAAARQLTVAGDRLFLSVFNPETGEELWTSDGTPAGTHLVADLNPGPAGSAPQSLTAVNSRLLFAADDGTSGLELWISDGTREGTALLQDIAPGPALSSPSDITVTRDRVFFLADDGAHGRELWSMPRSAAVVCPANGTTLCLQGGRFAVTVHWQTPNAPAARESAIRFRSPAATRPAPSGSSARRTSSCWSR